MEILDKTLAPIKTSWPPEYSLRISKKARHVHLKIRPDRGLEIIVPIRQQQRVIIADLLNEKKDWIEKHLSLLEKPVPKLITTMPLRAIEQTWHIEYMQTIKKRLQHSIRIGTTANTLILYGDVSDIERTHIWLRTWLKQMANTYLVSWLEDLSIKHQLPFNEASVRFQQTLWGSCTRQKNISLNCKLLCLPPNYAEHIMLHELCHTKHLNHSKHFWNLLMKLDPNCIENNKAMRKGDDFVPIGL